MTEAEAMLGGGDSEDEEAEDFASLVPHRCQQLPREDRRQFALVLFGLLGVGTLLPWNFFTTARSYFDCKLRNTSAETTADTDWMRATFESHLAVFSNVPGVLCVLANAMVAGRVSITGRMLATLGLMAVLFAVSAAFVMVDTDAHQTQFFWVTLASVALMTGSGAVMQGSLYGLVAMFPHRYINAVTLGQASGGVIAACAYIISLEIGSHPRSAAFLYFLTATGVLVACLVGYLVLRRLPFVVDTVARSKYSSDADRQLQQEPPPPPSYSAAAVAVPPAARLRPAWRSLAGPGAGAFLVLAVSLMLYPALLSSLAPMYNQWILYSPLSCFLAFNAADLLGRLLTMAARWPRHGAALVFLSLLRLLFVPLFLMCNYGQQPAAARIGGLPLLFSSDALPPILVAAFGLTNGYLFTLCLIGGSEGAPHGLAETHGAVMSFCAVLGSCTGSAMSFMFTATAGK